ncbi:MAG: M67 family metallopeptidase [Methanomassiliicoccales archaeon]
MVLHIPRGVIDEIYSHAKRTYPEECCGFLLGFADTTTVIRSRDAINSAPSRLNRYSIDPRTIMLVENMAREEGITIIGYYHSHPDHPAVPSEFDRAHAWPDISYLIVKVVQGEPDGFASWMLQLDGSRFVRQSVRIQ